MIRRTVAVASAALIALVGPAAASASLDAASPGTGAPVIAAPAIEAPVAIAESSITMSLRSYGPAVLEAVGELSATVDVANTGVTPASDLHVELRVTRGPIVTRARLDAFLGTPSGNGLVLAASRPVTTAGVAPGSGDAGILPRGGTEQVTITANPNRLGLPSGSSGVYGVVVQVVGPDGVVAAHASAVTWYDGAIPTLPVAVVATAAGAPERVARVAAASNIAGVALAVDPTAFANDADADAVAASREVFGLPSGAPDLRSLAHADDKTLLDFALDDAAQNAPESLDDLSWIAVLPGVDAATVTFAADHDAVAGLIDPALGGPPPAGSYVPLLDAIAGEQEFPVLVPEAGLSRAVATEDPSAADAPARVSAEAALAAWEFDGTGPVVVAPGLDWQLPGMGASPLVQALIDAPWVIPVTIDSVLDGESRRDVVARARTSTGRDMPPADVASLSRRLDRLDNLSLTVDDPDEIYVPGGRTLLAPLAMGLRGDDAARDATLGASIEAVNATLGAVRVPDSSDVNLIAASGNLPVTVYNDLSVDAEVRVVVRSTSANLRVLDWPMVTVPAGGSTTARVPVTGVSSANVTVTVALENSRTDTVAPPQSIGIRVRADWGNAMAIAFTVGIVVLLIAGVIRTIRRGRSGTRVAPAPAQHEEESGRG